MKYTKNYNLAVPEAVDVPDITKLSNNMAVIDKALKRNTIKLLELSVSSTEKVSVEIGEFDLSGYEYIVYQLMDYYDGESPIKIKKLDGTDFSIIVDQRARWDWIDLAFHHSETPGVYTVTASMTSPYLGSNVYKFNLFLLNLGSDDTVDDDFGTDYWTTLDREEVFSEIDTRVAQAIAEVVAEAPESLDTLKELSDWIKNHDGNVAEMNSTIEANKKALEDKVDKEDGKVLSDNNYSDEDKAKVDGLADDIETALDNIISIQNTLTGGDA